MVATNLITDLIDRAQRLGARVDSSKRAEALTAFDEAIQWYAGRVPWDALIRSEDFFTNGVRDLVLPDRVLRVINVMDAANATPVDAGDEWEVRTPGAFAQDTTGQVAEWRPGGFVPVIAQPTTDTTLSVEASVSESYSVYVRGLVRDTAASGTSLEFYEVQEEIMITSESSVSSANAYTEVLSIQKPKFTTSNILVTNNQAGTRISRIPAWEARPLFQKIQLHFVPVGSIPMRIRFYTRPNRITAETDAIEPGINEEAIIWRATGNLHWSDNEDQAAERAWAKAQEALSDVKSVEESFGEKGLQIQPWLGYLQMEGLYDDEWFG